MKIRLAKHRISIQDTIIIISLILAFAQATLRITDDGNSVLFRLYLPIVIITIATRNIRLFIQPILFVLAFSAYNIFVSLAFYNGIIDLSYYIHVIILALLYLHVKYLNEYYQNFNIQFYTFLDKVTIAIIILGWLQFFLRFEFPHIQSLRPYEISLFFWNGNELSAAISCVAVVYVFRFFARKDRPALIKAIIIAVMTYVNDAKLSLLGIITGVIVLFGFYLSTKLSRSSAGKKIALWFFVTLLILVLYLFITSGVNLHFRDYNLSIMDLIGRSIESIFKLETYGTVGSINVRTTAIVYGLRELIRTKFFGFGWGNSVTLITSYSLHQEKSMHNIIFQLLCECGYFAIICYMFIIKKLVHNSKKEYGGDLYQLQIAFAFSFIFISSQSSIGILSNYMLWTVVYYIALLDDLNPKEIIV